MSTLILLLLFTGVCHTSAAHGDAHDDTQLLLHYTKPTGPGDAPVSRLHPPVLARSCPPTPATSQPSQCPQQPSRPLVRHPIILYLIQRANATTTTAATAKVSTFFQIYFILLWPYSSTRWWSLYKIKI